MTSKKVEKGYFVQLNSDLDDFVKNQAWLNWPGQLSFLKKTIKKYGY
jgi:hypothetical protein